MGRPSQFKCIMTRSGTPPTIRTLRSLDEFTEIRRSWNALFQRTGCGTASMSAASIEAFLFHRLPLGTQAAIVIAEHDGQLIGALPLIRAERNGFVHMQTLHGLETFGIDFLIDSAWAGNLRKVLVDHVALSEPRLFSLTLLDVPGNSPTPDSCASLSNWAIHSDLSRHASYLRTPSATNDVRASVSTNFRKNLRKAETKLRARPDVRFRFISASDVHGECLDRFLALESAGWKGKAGTAINSNERTRSFYRTLTDLLVRDGLLEWHFLEVGGSVIGGHLAVRASSTLTLLKIAYDEGYSALAPGNLLFLEMLQNESGASRSETIDCLTDMPWHRNWKMSSRPHFTITLFPRRAVPLLFGYLPRVTADTLRRSDRLRRLVRTVRTLRTSPERIE